MTGLRITKVPADDKIINQGTDPMGEYKDKDPYHLIRILLEILAHSTINKHPDPESRQSDNDQDKETYECQDATSDGKAYLLISTIHHGQDKRGYRYNTEQQPCIRQNLPEKAHKDSKKNQGLKRLWIKKQRKKKKSVKGTGKKAGLQEREKL